MVFPLVVNACVLNQSHGHWLLTNAFHFVITMNTKLMDEDLGMVNELTLLASNIKKVFYCSSFYFILEKYEKKNTYVLSLMLDPRFKNLRLVSFLIGQE
jgi:hypothetical protein